MNECMVGYVHRRGWCEKWEVKMRRKVRVCGCKCEDVSRSECEDLLRRVRV